MSTPRSKAEEILSQGQINKSSQRCDHARPSNDEMFGAHLNSNSRKAKHVPHYYADRCNRSPGNTESTLYKIPDYQPKNNVNDASTGEQDRPRSKTRRPDVVVYVPRARRKQQSSTPEVNESRYLPHTSGDADTISKLRRNRTGMEVYVPRARRLQQEVETKQQIGSNKSAEDWLKVYGVLGNEGSETVTENDKESRKYEKHKSKERKVHTSDNDRMNDAGNKDHRKKHKHKFKKENLEKEEAFIHKHKKWKHTEQCKNTNDLPEGSKEMDKSSKRAEQQEGQVADNETWENEMNFYDSLKKNVESNDEIRLESDADIKVTETFIENEIFLKEGSAVAKDQIRNDTQFQLSGAHIIYNSVEQLHTETVSDCRGTSNNPSVSKDVKSKYTVVRLDSGVELTEMGHDSHILATKGEVQLEMSASNVHEAEDVGQQISQEMATDEPSANSSKRRKSSEGHLKLNNSCGNNTDLWETTKNTETADKGANNYVKCEGVPYSVGESKTSAESEHTCATRLSEVRTELTNVTQNVVQTENDSVLDVRDSYQLAGADEIADIAVALDRAISSHNKCEQEVDEGKIVEASVNNIKMDGDAVSMETDEDGDTWDSLYADDGEALNPKLMEELTVAVGKVKVQKTQFDYYNYQPQDPGFDDCAYGHLIEIYDFPTELITRDLLAVFREYK